MRKTVVKMGKKAIKTIEIFFREHFIVDHSTSRKSEIYNFLNGNKNTYLSLVVGRIVQYCNFSTPPIRLENM